MKRKNVVLILSDDQGYIAALRNLYGTGNDRIKDPNACAEVIP